MDTIHESSSLPSGVFRACDDSVEAALAGPVAEMFLAHMSSTVPGVYEDAAVGEQLAKNHVSAEEICAFLEQYAEAEDAPAPEVAHRLDEERIWVLADLATAGTGRARELATRELRDVVRRVSADHLDVDLLRRLVEAIDGRDPESSTSVLLQVLLGAARESLARIAAGELDD